MVVAGSKAQDEEGVVGSELSDGSDRDVTSVMAPDYEFPIPTHLLCTDTCPVYLLWARSNP